MKTIQMKADSILISDKMDFKAKTIVWDKMITTYWIRIFFKAITVLNYTYNFTHIKSSELQRNLTGS